MLKSSYIFFLFIFINHSLTCFPRDADQTILDNGTLTQNTPLPYRNSVPSLQALALAKITSSKTPVEISKLSHDLQDVLTALYEISHRSNIYVWPQNITNMLLGNSVVVEALLALNKELDWKDIIIKKILGSAAYHNKISIITFFLDRSIPVDTKVGSFEEPMLYTAAAKGHRKLVNLLLEHNANVNVRATFRNSAPLHAAVCSSKHKIIRLLLENGADLEAKNQLDQTPLQLAQAVLHCGNTKKHHAVINILSEHTVKRAVREKEFITQASVGNIPALQRLLQENVHVDAQDEHGSTPLMLAARNGYLETVKFLLENHANPVIANNLRQDARSLALSTGEHAIAHLLDLTEQSTSTSAHNITLVRESGSVRLARPSFFGPRIYWSAHTNNYY